MEVQKSYNCHVCKRQRATGVWLLKKKSGSQEVKMLCTSCWFTEIPQRETVLHMVFLHSLLSPESYSEAEECEMGLVPTGEATVLKSMDEESRLIGVFFEMKCPKCGFSIDIGATGVNAAKVSYLHPNRNYDKYKK